MPSVMELLNLIFPLLKMYNRSSSHCSIWSSGNSLKFISLKVFHLLMMLTVIKCTLKKNHSYKVTTSTCWRVDPLLTNTDYSVSALWPFPRAVIMWPPESLDMRKKPPEGKWSLRGTRAAWIQGHQEGGENERKAGFQGTGHQDQAWPLASPCTVEQRVGSAKEQEMK